MNEKYYAHSLENHPLEKWQSLEAHLDNVAQRCRSFAGHFNAGSWGDLAGRFHDLGKGSRQFQAYLRWANRIEDEFAPYFEPRWRRDHASFAAKHLYSLSDQVGKLLAYCLAGHHGGLQNWSNDKKSGLRYRVEDKKLKEITFSFDQQPSMPSPADLPFQLDQMLGGFQLQFFIRMLFSCLVDADRLDTEAFMQPEKTKHRENKATLEELHGSFWRQFDCLREKAKPSKVNEVRENVLKDCLAAARRKPGLFTLTVPTGGGKTLASLAFALEHAKIQNKEGKQLRRIIYVIPFTSIIEQNAKVFREMLGDEAVLEHHSNFIPDETDWKSKLAAENWDAPVVVTTNVQFFDSFFANKTSKCRKLHNITDSVVIFDEVQAIPVEKLQPCIEVLRELTKNYGVSAVLCTATQPAISKSEYFKNGLDLDQAEIIQDVPSLFNQLQRTRQTWLGRCAQEDIAERLCQEEQGLCIVSTRDQALTLFEEIKELEGSFHLSALMYPLHRSKIFKEIRTRLNPQNPQPCRVISTQLIEAGVDVDFPVVFRSLAGMDSIAQAAGRCNREGRRDMGEVFIYKPEKKPPAGYFRQTSQCAERLFTHFAGRLIEPECIEAYFHEYFWLKQDQMDKDEILEECQVGQQNGEFSFAEIAKFRMIENANQAIVIALDTVSAELVKQLKYVEFPGPILRRLQQYSVQVYPDQFKELEGWLERPCLGLDVYVLENKELYSEKTGLECQPPAGQGFIL